MTNSEEHTLGEMSILLRSHVHSFEEHKQQVKEAHERLEKRQEKIAETVEVNSQRITALETTHTLAKWLIGLFAAGGTATGAAIAHLFGRGGGGQ